MKELKCPHCGSVFSVDEADYASILNQVKNAEFEAEIERRMRELNSRHKVEQELASNKAEQNFQKKLTQKELELVAKEAEIGRLRSQLENIGAQKDSEMRIAVMEERNKSHQSLLAKDSEIAHLKSEAELEKSRAKIHEAELVKHHEHELKAKQELVDYYKDLKTRMSTKMVGETLEIHCSTLFNQMLRPMMPHAYFEKDNDAADGTKGDFIFRDSEEGTEYVSIMFEMKNEMDTTATKHRNEDFFKKLDEDRRKKGCEFAVLVSLLEPDN